MPCPDHLLDLFFCYSPQASHLPSLSPVTTWSVSTSPTLCPSAFSGAPQSFTADCFLFMVATVAQSSYFRGTTFTHLYAHLAQWSRSLADTSASCHPSGEGGSLHPWSLLFALWYHFQCKRHNLYTPVSHKLHPFFIEFSLFLYQIFYIYIHIYNSFNGQNKAIYDTLLWAGVGRILPITNRVGISVVVVNSSTSL